MTVSITDLLTIPTKSEILDKFAGLLRLAGFPVASWQTTSFMRHTVESESDLYVDIATGNQKLGMSGFIRLVAQAADDGLLSSDWVDLTGEETYAEPRKPAIFTQGTAVLTDVAGVGPLTIDPETYWISNVDRNLRFFNKTGGVLPLNGSLSLTFQAETAGSDWNVAVGELVESLTPQPGVTVSNPSLDTGTWITQQGANAEANMAYANRCLLKWSLIGPGGDEGAYLYRALSASPEITDARVYSAGAGSVRVVLRGDAGPVSETARAAAETAVLARRLVGVPDVQVLNSTAFLQALTGVVQVTMGKSPTATLAGIQKSGNAFGRKLPIGGKVSREKLIQALVVDGVDDLELSTPAGDYQLGPNEVWVPTYLLTTG